eukprot:COSAG02_NODE_1866_length_10601_cov_9.335841_2_plen_100_part_00
MCGADLFDISPAVSARDTHTILTTAHLDITAQRCVGRELVRAVAPGRPVCASDRMWSLPKMWSLPISLAAAYRTYVYFTDQFTPVREGKCRQLECMLER